MVALIIRRTVTTLAVFVGVTLLIFGGIAMLEPERRASLYTHAIDHRQPEVVIRMLGYDQPLLVQYTDWLFGRKRIDYTGEERIYGGVTRGDLGRSRSAGKPTIQVVREQLPRTLELTLLSLPLMATGVWWGMRAGLSRGQRFTRIVQARYALSIPALVLGWFIIILTQRTNWFIVGEISKEVASFYGLEQLVSYTGMLTVDSLLNGRSDVFVFALQHTVLPVLTLSLVGWTLLFQVARSSVLVALQSGEFIAMQGRGLSEKMIVKEYIRPKVRDALLAASGYLAFTVVDDVLIVEALFGYPGLGATMARAAASLDVLAVTGILLFTSTVALAIKLAAEIAQIIFARRTGSWRSISSDAQAKV